MGLRVGHYNIGFPPISPEATELPVTKAEIHGQGERLVLNLLLKPDELTPCRAEYRREIRESGVRSKDEWGLSSHERLTFPSGDDLDLAESLMPTWLLQGFAQLVYDLNLEQVNYFLQMDGCIQLSLMQARFFVAWEPLQYVYERVAPVLWRHSP